MSLVSYRYVFHVDLAVCFQATEIETTAEPESDRDTVSLNRLQDLASSTPITGLIATKNLFLNSEARTWFAL
jgi:hypothetical protein